jgi:hypothetical protein
MQSSCANEHHDLSPLSIPFGVIDYSPSRDAWPYYTLGLELGVNHSLRFQGKLRVGRMIVVM